MLGYVITFNCPHTWTSWIPEPEGWMIQYNDDEWQVHIINNTIKYHTVRCGIIDDLYNSSILRLDEVIFLGIQVANRIPGNKPGNCYPIIVHFVPLRGLTPLNHSCKPNHNSNPTFYPRLNPNYPYSNFSLPTQLLTPKTPHYHIAAPPQHHQHLQHQVAPHPNRVPLPMRALYQL